MTTKGAEVIRVAREVNAGFLTDEKVALIAGDDLTRLQLILVRCHEGRFMAPAQDVAALLAVVEAAGWYVRDVSLPADIRNWRDR
jgi:hypothetical protein